jgi:hypothetical protein
MTTPIVLDWRHCRVLDTPRTCVLCGQPALLLSPRGRPCHKTCAETWHATHPQTHTAADDGLIGGGVAA